MKSAPRLILTIDLHSLSWSWVSYFIPLFCLLLTPHNIFAQDTKPEENFQEKAILFKNRLKYDSSIFYFKKLNIILENSADIKGKILNELELCDIYILQRNYRDAKGLIDETSKEIANLYASEIDLVSNLYQLKGSYLLSQGETDSAKYYLDQSISMRNTLHGDQDTLLHYAYNKLGNLYLSKANYDLAFDYHKKALAVSLRKQNPVNFLTASSYQNLGIAAHMKGDFNLAEDCYTKSLHLKEQLFDQNDPALIRIYINLGKFSVDVSKYDQALEYFNKAEHLLLLLPEMDNLLYAHVYINKGNLYTYKGDYEKAISYLTKALSYRVDVLGNNNVEVLSAQMDLGLAFEKKGDTVNAIDFYKKSSKSKDNPSIIKAYRNLGNIYKNLNENDSADKYFNLSIEFARKFFSGDSYDLALCYKNYGEFLAKTNKNDKLEWYYTRAAEIFIQLFGKKNKDLSRIYFLQSEYFISINDYGKALGKIQDALIAILPVFDDKNPDDNPDLDNNVLDLYFPNSLCKKAIILYERYKQTNNLKDLKLSLSTINLTLAVIEEIRKTYNEEESQLILNRDARTVIDLGVEVTYNLYEETDDKYYLSEAFQFTEKGQAIILLSALRGLDAKSNAELPRNVVNLENQLSQQLAIYNSFLYQEKQKISPDPGKIQLWSDKIFNLRVSHDSLISSYKKLYPEYFRLKYDFTTISADSAIICLPSDQAIIEYHLTDSLVFAFIISNGTLSAKKLGDRSALVLKLDKLRKIFIRNDYFNPGETEFDSLTNLSADLYQILIQPFENQITGKRLIVVPDGELGYLSFDMLLKERPNDKPQDYKDLTWLIKSNAINYSSSSTIHFEQTGKVIQEVPGEIIAFSPSYNYVRESRSATDLDTVMLKLSPIKGTKEEINSISKLFNTKKLFDQKATEAYFKKHAGDYNILHLAMHTIIDNQNPLYSKLVFTAPPPGSAEDGYLNTYELFSLHLPGQLAVLSACNTGSGKLERGEGIISLARGFFYAGIPSVVMTLWEIEDHSSADLMERFYENLKLGLPNDIALQQAKISYLERAGKLQSHPYFWAGYVSIGKTDPVKYTSGWKPLNIVYLLIGITIIILIIFIFINRRVYFHKKRY